MDISETLKELRQSTHYTRTEPFVQAEATGPDNRKNTIETDSWKIFLEWFNKIIETNWLYNKITIESSQEGKLEEGTHIVVIDMYSKNNVWTGSFGEMV